MHKTYVYLLQQHLGRPQSSSYSTFSAPRLSFFIFITPPISSYFTVICSQLHVQRFSLSFKHCICPLYIYIYYIYIYIYIYIYMHIYILLCYAILTCLKYIFTIMSPRLNERYLLPRVSSNPIPSFSLSSSSFLIF
jgi:hypothetical protein